MVSPILFVVGPLAAAFLMIFINNRAVALALSLATPALLAVLGLSWLPVVLQRAQPILVASLSAPLGIPMSIDALAASMAILVAVSATLVVLYSSSYMKGSHHEVRYYAVVMILLTSAFGFVLTRDLFNLFVFFEILCISSFILVSWEQNAPSLEASFKYMVLGAIGSTFLLVAIALSYRLAGRLDMAGIAQAYAGAPKAYTALAAALFLFGVGVEAAIFPVNTWLPDAHSSAPSSISAILSGFVIELSLLVVFRVLNTVFGAVDMLPVLMVVAIIGVVVGEFSAYAQKDLKRMLAYSSVSQIGIMLFAFSIGTPESAQAGLQHLLMHTGAKSALFLIAGYFIVRTGSRLVEDYVGLGRRMPVSAALFGLAALSLVGAPPLFGFFTKLQILQAAAGSGGALAWAGIAIILLGTAVEAMYLFRVLRILFSTAHDAENAPENATGAEATHTEMAGLTGPREIPLAPMTAIALFTALVVFGALLLPALSSMIGPIAEGLANLR